MNAQVETQLHTTQGAALAAHERAFSDYAARRPPCGSLRLNEYRISPMAGFSPAEISATFIHHYAMCWNALRSTDIACKGTTARVLRDDCEAVPRIA